MGLFTRLSLAMCALVVATAGAVVLAAYHALERSLAPRERDMLRAGVISRAGDLSSLLDDERPQALILAASPAVDGLIRAIDAGGLDPVDRVDASVWRDRLADLFLAALEARPAWLQVRLIGVADGGRELVRAERVAAGAPAVRTVDAKLQRKGDRPYFWRTIALAAGATSVSPIELNQERGQVVDPPVPVIRYATPVRDGTGAVFGVVVINVDVSPALAAFEAGAPTYAQVYVAAERGDYLIHPDPALRFANDRGGNVSWRTDLPHLAGALADAPAAVLDAGDSGLLAAARVASPSAAGLVLIERIPAVLAGATAVVQRTVLGVVAIAACIAVLVALVLARSLTRPITRLSHAMAAFAGEPPTGLPTRLRSEVGALARSFEGMANDTIARAAALRVLSQRERLHAAVVESSLDSILVTDLERHVTAWNPAASALYGVSIDDALGRPVLDVLDPEHHDQYAELLDQAVATGRSVDLELDYRLAAGGRQQLLVRSSAVSGATGAVIGLAIIARDVSAARRAERQISRIFEVSAHGMLLVARDGAVRRTNDAARRVFLLDQECLTDLNIDDLLPRKYREMHARQRAAYLEAPSVRPMGPGRDLIGLRTDGTQVSVEVTLSPFEGPDGETLVLATVIDITERKRVAERSLADYAERLEQSNSDLKQFAAVVSHDLRAPVHQIGLLAGWIEEELRNDAREETRENLGMLRSRTQRLNALIEGILAYSSAGTSGLRPKIVDTRLTVDEILLSLEIPRGFDVRVSGEWPRLYVDPTQLTQILQNLIQNALRHHGKPAGRIEVGCERSVDRVVFHVRDDGVGIPEAHRERVFRLFETLRPKDELGTTGIGLAIVKRMVERNGGTIGIGAPPGGGADVFVSLPADLIREE